MRFQGMGERIPQPVQGLMQIWEQMYWLAKTNRICTGQITHDERQQFLLQVEAA